MIIVMNKCSRVKISCLGQEIFVYGVGREEIERGVLTRGIAFPVPQVAETKTP